MGCDLHNYYWCGAACFLGVANSPACTVHSGRSLTKPLPARSQAVDQVVEGVFEAVEFGVGGGAKSEAPLRAPEPEPRSGDVERRRKKRSTASRAEAGSRAAATWKQSCPPYLAETLAFFGRAWLQLSGWGGRMGRSRCGAKSGLDKTRYTDVAGCPHLGRGRTRRAATAISFCCTATPRRGNRPAFRFLMYP